MAQPILIELASGSRIAFIEAGPKGVTNPSQALPPVVLVHGSLCDYRYWQPQFNAISEHRHVIAVSLPFYHPAREQPEQPGFGVRQHVDALLQLFKHQQWGPVALVGHSRGGSLAFQLASREPSAVASLVLADPGGAIANTINTPHTHPAQNPYQGHEEFDSQTELASANTTDPRLRAAQMVSEGHVDAGLELFVDTVSRPGFWRRSPPAFKAMSHDNALTLPLQMQETLPAYTHTDAAKISAPTLLINGDKSPDIFVSGAETLAQWIPNAQRILVKGASHGMNLSHANEFNRLVINFLANNNH